MTLFLTASLVVTAYAVTQVRDFESEARGRTATCETGKYKNVACATVTVTPNPAPAETYITLSATGLVPSAQLNVVQDGVVMLVYSDAAGSFSFQTWSGSSGSGIHNIQVKELVNGTYVIAGSTTYQVY